MIRITLLAAALCATVGVALAAPQTPSPKRLDSSPARTKLDTNGDGAIDRNQAAGSPKLAARFDQLDRNRDGRLDRSERPQRHGKERGGERGDKSGAIAALDANGDGRFSRAELAGKPKLAEHFAAIDVDRDGALTHDELRAYRQAMRPQHEAKRAERFAAADRDQDGRLSQAEVQGRPKLAQRFAILDANGDGFLSREELGRQQRR